MKTVTMLGTAFLGVGLIAGAMLIPRRIGTAPIENPAVALLAITGIVVFVASLALLPKRIAEDRCHPQVDAIGVCAVVGVVFPPAWLVALVWAFTNPRG